MAEINQPTPIKPVWPQRREQHPSKQRQPERNPEDDAEGHRRRKDGDGKTAVIDEYA